MKCRLWDKIGKKMYYNGNLENGSAVVMNIEGGLQFSDNDTYKEKDFISMQSTGLKDKNGKEIYEGDIIKVSYRNGWYIGVIETYRYSKRIKLLKGNYVLVGRKWRDDYYVELYETDNYEIETTGNIYQNSEMLR